MGKKRNLNDESNNIPTKKRFLSQFDQYTSGYSSIQRYLPQSPEFRSGKILRIRLINFMCHDHLVVDFNRRANLLIGSNGSGKSAILTAIVIGLGSSARTTNRSTNIKSLIKRGESSATIEIDIANDCSYAYESAKFGKKITVIRHFTANGSSTYKVKTEKGDIVCKTNAQLQKILLYHNIQADNPILVLNQDNARTYLRDLDPKKNYDLFLKATRIECILNNLEECALLYNKIKFRHDQFKKYTETILEEVHTLQKKYDRLRSADNIQQSIKKYNIEKLWAIVIEQENVIKENERKVSLILKKQKPLEEALKNKDTIENKHNEEIRELEEKLNKLNVEYSNKEQELNTIKSNLNKDDTKLQIELVHVQKLENQIKHLQEQINLLQASITEKSNTERTQEIRQENEEKISKYQDDIKNLDSMSVSANRDLKLLCDTKSKLVDQTDGLHHRKMNIVQRNDNLRKQLESIKFKKNDNLSVYGDYTKQLLISIERAYKAGKFSEKPRGPVGKYIEVVDKKWKGLIEHTLSGCLRMYLVNSVNDRKTLDHILQTEFPGVKLSILTGQFHHDVYNVENGMVYPPEGSHLLMNLIKCSDPIVMNCLIDRAQIETILLVENLELAQRLTTEQENVPRNLTKVLVLDPLMEYFPAPLYRAYSLEVRQPRFLQVNVEETIRNLRQEIKNGEEKLQQMEVELRELKHKLKNAREDEIKMRKNLDKHEKSKTRLKAELEELQNVVYGDEDEIEFLKKESIELENKLKTIKEHLEEKQNVCLTFSQNIEKITRIYQEKILAFNNLKEKIKSFMKKRENLQSDLQDIARKIQQQEKHNSEYLKEINSLNKILQKESKKLESLIKKAESAGERVETQRSVQELIDLIKANECKFRQIISSEDNIEEVEALLNEKRSTAKKNVMLIEIIDKTLKMLNKCRYSKCKLINILKQHMSLRIKIKFEDVLKIRKFSGKIDIDHSERKLLISVIPRDSQIQNAVSNTKALSGGERSFSTVAFLLALWACVDHPFFILDEYDVFTDQVNREIITKLLLHEAENKPNAQFIFLTPQDMSFVTGSESLTIHRLKDPERRTQ